MADKYKQKPQSTEPVPEPGRDRATYVVAWIAAGTSFVAAVAGVVGVIIGSSLSREQASAAHQAETYAIYLSELAAFNETAWSITSWAGEGATSSQPDDNGDFWASARVEQASLETAYLTAAMATKDTEISALLRDIRADQQKTWLELKCAAGLQSAHCPSGTVSNDVVVSSVAAWSARLETAKSELVDTVSGR